MTLPVFLPVADLARAWGLSLRRTWRLLRPLGLRMYGPRANLVSVPALAAALDPDTWARLEPLLVAAQAGSRRPAPSRALI